MRLFSNVWSENTALFERLMEIHSNSPKLYYGFNVHAHEILLSYICLINVNTFCFCYIDIVYDIHVLQIIISRFIT